MNASVDLLAEHGLTLLAGATGLMAVACLAVVAQSAPIHRQRIAEASILTLLVWLVVALIPLPRVSLASLAVVLWANGPGEAVARPSTALKDAAQKDGSAADPFAADPFAVDLFAADPFAAAVDGPATLREPERVFPSDTNDSRVTTAPEVAVPPPVETPRAANTPPRAERESALPGAARDEEAGITSPGRQPRAGLSAIPLPNPARPLPARGPNRADETGTDLRSRALGNRGAVRASLPATSPAPPLPALGTQAASTGAGRNLAKYLVQFYLIGLVLCVGWLGLGRVLLAAVCCRAAAPEPWLRALCQSLTPQTVRVRWMVSRQVARAVSFGLLRPSIVLPEAFCQPDRADRLQHVLVHELAHLAQRDAAGQTLFNLAFPLLYFHPLYWWLRGQAHLAAELLADDRAVQGAPRESYVRALVDLAAEPVRPRLTRLTYHGMSSSPKQFYRRMQMLLQRNQVLASRCSWRWRTATLAACAAVLVVACAAAGVRPAQAADAKSSEEIDRLKKAAETLQSEKEALEKQLQQLRAEKKSADSKETQPQPDSSELLAMYDVKGWQPDRIVSFLTSMPARARVSISPDGGRVLVRAPAADQKQVQEKHERMTPAYRPTAPITAPPPYIPPRAADLAPLQPSYAPRPAEPTPRPSDSKPLPPAYTPAASTYPPKRVDPVPIFAPGTVAPALPAAAPSSSEPRYNPAAPSQSPPARNAGLTPAVPALPFSATPRRAGELPPADIGQLDLIRLADSWATALEKLTNAELDLQAAELGHLKKDSNPEVELRRLKALRTSAIWRKELLSRIIQTEQQMAEAEAQSLRIPSDPHAFSAYERQQLETKKMRAQLRSQILEQILKTPLE